MRRGFIYVVVAVILLGSCRAEQDDITASFEKALVEPDIIICQTSCEPLFQKATKGGFFTDANLRDGVLVLVAERVLADNSAGFHCPDLQQDHDEARRRVRSDPVLPFPHHCRGGRA